MPFSTYFAYSAGTGTAFRGDSPVEQSHGCAHLSRETAAKCFETPGRGAGPGGGLEM